MAKKKTKAGKASKSRLSGISKKSASKTAKKSGNSAKKVPAKTSATRAASVQAKAGSTKAPPAASRRRAKPTAAPSITRARGAALSHEQIADRAYTIWLRRGRMLGDDARNWAEAEAQLKAELGID